MLVIEELTNQSISHVDSPKGGTETRSNAVTAGLGTHQLPAEVEVQLL